MTMPDDDALARAREVLGVGPDDDARALRSAFRKRSMETHPDKQGSADAFEEVRVSYELLLPHAPQSEPEAIHGPETIDADDGTDAWFVDDVEDELDIRIIDEEKSPRRRRFEEMFLDALRREHGE